MRSVLLLLVFCVGSFAVKAQVEVIDQVLATVGGEIVLMSEVEEQYSLMASQQRPVNEQTRCFILEQLLVNKMMVNQAKLDSVEVSDVEVETQLDARIEQILGYMNGSIEQFEAYYGQTVEEVRDEFRQDLQSQLLQERMRGDIMSNVKVTPSEVKAFFDQIPTDSLPYFNSEVELGEIVAVPQVSTEERERVRNLMLDLRQQIVDSTATFEDLAARYSEDGTRNFGGDLGWSARGKFVQEFEAAAYKLELNEVSQPVETQFGFHLIQMLGRRGSQIRVRHILVRPEIKDTDLEQSRKFLDSVRQLIQTDSLSFSEAVKQFSDEDQESYNNDGRMVNPATGNTFFEVGDLDPDIFFAIDTMEIGDLSAPFEYRVPGGGSVNFRMVQLQSRTRPHTANLQQDYSKIRQAAIESKRNEYINNWVQETIGDTFIRLEVNPNVCPNLKEWVQERTVIRP
jgi:peptidyl-prolyl cis-trans isomerase SurA